MSVTTAELFDVRVNTDQTHSHWTLQVTPISNHGPMKNVTAAVNNMCNHGGTRWVTQESESHQSGMLATGYPPMVSPLRWYCWPAATAKVLMAVTAVETVIRIQATTWHFKESSLWHSAANSYGTSLRALFYLAALTRGRSSEENRIHILPHGLRYLNEMA